MAGLGFSYTMGLGLILRQATGGGTGVPALPAALNVAILAQSNGAQNNSSAPAPASIIGLSSRAKIWNHNTQARENYDPLTNSDTLSQTTTYPQYYGPEGEIMRLWIDQDPGNSIDIVKGAYGGVALHPDDVPTWHPTLGNSVWPFMSADIAAWKVAAAAAGRDPKIHVLIIIQGEADGTDATWAAAYAQNLAAVDAAARAQWGDANMITIVSRIAPSIGNIPYKEPVRTAQVAFEDNSGKRFWVDIDDIPNDGLHTTKVGIEPHGARCLSVIKAPRATAVPTISGTAQVGQTLTRSAATWDYIPISTAIRWFANGVAILGATNSTYLLTASEQGKLITARDSATSKAGTTYSTSAATVAVAAAPSYQSETTALLAAMSSQPNGTRATAIDTLIAGLKTDGLWTKLKALQIFSMHDEQAAKLEWKTATQIVQLNGAPPYTVDRGWTLDGTSQSIRTGVVENTLSGVSLNAAGFGLIVRSGTTTNSLAGIAGSSAHRLTFSKAGSGGVTMGIHTAATTALSSVDGSTSPLIAHHYGQRYGANAINYYNNGVKKNPALLTSTSSSMNTVETLLGQSGTGPTYAPAGFFAHYMTAGDLTDPEIANLHTRLTTFKTAIGA